MLQTRKARTIRPAASMTAGALGECLIFCLGTEEYGIDILKMQETRSYDAVTAIANAPSFIKGVIDLRVTIVAIVDLRIKFDLGAAYYDAFTAVIILNVARRVIGIVADSVSDLLTLQAGRFKAVPEFSATLNTQYILGLGTVDERMLILVKIEHLMTGADMALVDKALQ